MACAVGEAADVVEKQDVDAAHAETLEARLERALYSAAAVIEDGTRALDRELIPRRARPTRLAAHETPDLGREDVTVARVADERASHALLAQAMPVEGRGIKVADTLRKRRSESCLRLLLGHLLVEVADWGTAEAERRDLHARHDDLRRRHRNPLPLEHHDAVDAAGRGGRYGEQRLAAKVRELDLLVAVEIPRGLDAGDRRQHQVGLLPGKDVHVDTIAPGSSDAPAAWGDGPGARAVDRIAMSAQPRTDCL